MYQERTSSPQSVKDSLPCDVSKHQDDLPLLIPIIVQNKGAIILWDFLIYSELVTNLTMSQ